MMVWTKLPDYGYVSTRFLKNQGLDTTRKWHVKNIIFFYNLKKKPIENSDLRIKLFMNHNIKTNERKFLRILAIHGPLLVPVINNYKSEILMSHAKMTIEKRVSHQYNVFKTGNRQGRHMKFSFGCFIKHVIISLCTQ